MKLKQKDNTTTKVKRNIKDNIGIKSKISSSSNNNNYKNNKLNNTNTNTKGNDKINGKSLKNNNSNNNNDNYNINKLNEMLSLLDNIDELVVPNNNSNINKYKNAITDIFNIAVSSSAKQYGPLKTIVDIPSSSAAAAAIDVESIWEQLQLRNKPILRNIKKKTIQLINQYQ